MLIDAIKKWALWIGLLIIPSMINKGARTGNCLRLFAFHPDICIAKVVLGFCYIVSSKSGSS